MSNMSLMVAPSAEPYVFLRMQRYSPSPVYFVKHRAIYTLPSSQVIFFFKLTHLRQNKIYKREGLAQHIHTYSFETNFVNEKRLNEFRETYAQHQENLFHFM